MHKLIKKPIISSSDSKEFAHSKEQHSLSSEGLQSSGEPRIRTSKIKSLTSLITNHVDSIFP